MDNLSRHLRKLPDPDVAAVLPCDVWALARIFPVLKRVNAIARAPSIRVPDPQDLKRRAFSAFAELLCRMRDRLPLIVSFDDVQWFDRDAAQFMRALFVRPELPPLLLICVHRCESTQGDEALEALQSAARYNAALDVRTLSVGRLAPAALSSTLLALPPH